MLLEPYSTKPLVELRGPLPMTNWVIPDHVLCGAMPCCQDDQETEFLLVSLLESAGINSFVCLQAEMNLHVSEQAWRSGAALRCAFAHGWPVHDWSNCRRAGLPHTRALTLLGCVGSVLAPHCCKHSWVSLRPGRPLAHTSWRVDAHARRTHHAWRCLRAAVVNKHARAKTLLTLRKLLCRPYVRDAQRILTKARQEGSSTLAQRQIDFLQLPIEDGGVATDHAMHRLAEDCCQRILNGERLYIHCWGGHGRTGTLVSILLGRLYGMDARAALRYCQKCHDSRRYPQDTMSPQTPAQRAQVRAHGQSCSACRVWRV